MELRMNHAKPIAHVSEDGRCHLLYDHLVGTAKIAADMSGEFGCAKWGLLTGRVDHSTVGGIFAGEKFGKIGRILVYFFRRHNSTMIV